MKKFVSGLLVGALLMFSAQVYGTSSKLVGAEVGGTMDVNLEGKKIGEAAVIEGKSYLPVRDLANGLKMEVKVDNKVINLEQSAELKEANRKRSEELAQKAKEEQEKFNEEAAKKNKVSAKEKEIEIQKENIKTSKAAISYEEEEMKKIVTNKGEAAAKEDFFYKLRMDSKSRYEQRLVEEEAQLKKLEAELAELEK